MTKDNIHTLLPINEPGLSRLSDSILHVWLIGHLMHFNKASARWQTLRGVTVQSVIKHFGDGIHWRLDHSVHYTPCWSKHESRLSTACLCGRVWATKVQYKHLKVSSRARHQQHAHEGSHSFPFVEIFTYKYGRFEIFWGFFQNLNLVVQCWYVFVFLFLFYQNLHDTRGFQSIASVWLQPDFKNVC